jgi:stage II sporulation protein R
MVRKFLFAFAAILAISSVGANAAYHDELIRLHVLADSDAEADQALKLEVRDGVLECVGALLADSADADDAARLIEENKDAIADAARAVIHRAGAQDEIHVETGVFTFPEREYGGAVVPAGEYRALRVLIGSGAGQNWWCVLYPNLCAPVPETDEVVYYSVVVEWLMTLFGGGI